MKEQGPNPHVPQAVEDLQLAELTEHTESNTPQILFWALDMQWGAFEKDCYRRWPIMKDFNWELGHSLQLTLSK